MRLAPLLVTISMLSACGGPQRTVLSSPPAAPVRALELRAQSTHADRELTYVVAPVFAQPRPVVFAAVLMACDRYCHDKPDLVSPDQGIVHVFDTNTWTGSVPLTISLVDLGDGRTRMDMEASKASDFIGDSSSLQRKRMRGFAEEVERGLALVAAVNAAQAPTTTGSSATSRP